MLEQQRSTSKIWSVFFVNNEATNGSSSINKADTVYFFNEAEEASVRLRQCQRGWDSFSQTWMILRELSTIYMKMKDCIWNSFSWSLVGSSSMLVVLTTILIFASQSFSVILDCYSRSRKWIRKKPFLCLYIFIIYIYLTKIYWCQKTQHNGFLWNKL